MLDQEVVQNLIELEKDDNAGLLASLHAIYKEKGPSIFAEIEKALAASDAAAIKGAAHSFKSSCGNIGAISLSQLCQRMEFEAGAGKLSGVEAMLAEMRALFDEAERELGAVAASRGGP